MPTDDPNLPARTSSAPEPAAPHRFGRRGLVAGSLVALLVLGGLGWAAWRLTQPQAPARGAQQAGPGAPGTGAPGAGGGRAGPATTVGVATAERTDMKVTLEALGTVTPVATARVRPQVSGPLQEVRYQEGQLVRKGDLLAIIDPRPFEMALQQATGQRMRDEAQLEAAKVTLQRYQTLLQQDSIARQDVDTQAALVKQLEAAVVVDKANEGTARLNLSYTRIVAPIGGRLGLRPVDVGNVVTTGDANGVAIITQLSPIDVQFAIPQDQVWAVMQGGKAPMEVRALDRTRSVVLDTGTFSSLDNLVDPQTGTVKAKARFTNAKGNLFPSQFVNVQLQLRTLEGVTTVPVSAVRNGPNGEQVFVLNPDRTVSLRQVQRGQSTTERVQIVKGLEPGERVITEGADRLRDGSRVILSGDQQRGPRGAASGARANGQQPPAAPLDSASQPAAPAAVSSAPRAAQPSTPISPSTRGQPTPSPGGAPASAAAGPSPEARKRMLDAAANDPEQLERRKRFLEAIDRGDPQALERWQQMQQRFRQQGGGTQ